MKLDTTIKISDLIAVLTVTISLAALLNTLSKDRAVKESERASRVRDAAAKAISQLDRWRQVELSLYDSLQPAFVETSEMLQQDFNVVKARDHLWRTIGAEVSKVRSKTSDDQIGIGYLDALSYAPKTRTPFLAAFERLQEIERSTVEKLLTTTQNDVLSFRGRQNEYTSAMLGNALRASAAHCRDEMQSQSKGTIESTQEVFFEIINSSDEDLQSLVFR